MWPLWAVLDLTREDRGADWGRAPLLSDGLDSPVVIGRAEE